VAVRPRLGLEMVALVLTVTKVKFRLRKVTSFSDENTIRALAALSVLRSSGYPVLHRQQSLERYGARL
jgi:hypothetical protein